MIAEDGTHRQERDLWQYLLPNLIKLLPRTFPKLYNLDVEYLHKLIDVCEFLFHEAGDEINMENGGIVAEGRF